MTITLQEAKAILKQSSFKNLFDYNAMHNFDELFTACIEKSDRASIENILSKGFDISLLSSPTVLVEKAAKKGSVRTVKALIENGMLIGNAVHIAALEGHIGVLQYLAAIGANLSAKKSIGAIGGSALSPLEHGAMNKLMPHVIVKLLCKLGADYSGDKASTSMLKIFKGVESCDKPSIEILKEAIAEYKRDIGEDIAQAAAGGALESMSLNGIERKNIGNYVEAIIQNNQWGLLKILIDLKINIKDLPGSNKFIEMAVLADLPEVVKLLVSQDLQIGNLMYSEFQQEKARQSVAILKLGDASAASKDDKFKAEGFLNQYIMNQLIAQNDIVQLKQLIDLGLDIKSLGHSKFFIYEAISHINKEQNIDLINLLLDAGCGVKFGRDQAILSGNIDIISAIFNKHPSMMDAEMTGASNLTPLEFAATLGKAEVINWLLKHGAKFEPCPKFKSHNPQAYDLLASEHKKFNEDCLYDGPSTEIDISSHVHKAAAALDQDAHSALSGNVDDTPDYV